MSLSNPTSNVTITATCPAKTYSITPTITNGTASGDNTITHGGTASVTIAPSQGYTLPGSITVSGAAYTYVDTTGVVSLSDPTGDITITAECPAEATGDEIEVSDQLTKVAFDITATTETVNAFLAGLTYSDGFASLVTCSNVGNEETGHDVIMASYDSGENIYSIFVGTTTDGESGDIDYSGGYVYNSSDGWDTTVLENGEIEINITPTPVVSAVSAAEGWNGTLIKKA